MGHIRGNGVTAREDYSDAGEAKNSMWAPSFLVESRE